MMLWGLPMKKLHVVTDITHWAATTRRMVIDTIRREPHQYTKADLDFAVTAFGQTENEFWQPYYDAQRLAMVGYPDEVINPMYLFAVGPTGFITTLVGKSYRPLALTKALIRFSRTDEGRSFFEGTHGAGDVADVDAGIFNTDWAAAIGFVYCDTISAYGTRFNRYLYMGE